MSSKLEIENRLGMPHWPYFRMPFRLDANFEAIQFRADPDAVASLTPPPLISDHTGRCILTSLTGESEHWGAFNETFISIACQLHGEAGYYCLIVFLDSPRALCAGRETLGVPKVLSAVRCEAEPADWESEGSGLEWHTIYERQELIHSKTREYKRINMVELPNLLGPLWCLKIIPNPSGEADPEAVRQLVSIEDAEEVVGGPAKAAGVMELSFGQATVGAGQTGGIDLRDLKPIEVFDAYRFTVSCNDGLGTVVHDYLRP